jgi:hypothetical protein
MTEYYTEADITHTDPKDFKYKGGQYSFTTGFGKLDKLVGNFDDEDGCYWYEERLRKAGVTTPKGVYEDHEMSCCYFNFKSITSARSFLKRLNKWIEDRINLVASL